MRSVRLALVSGFVAFVCAPMFAANLDEAVAKELDDIEAAWVKAESTHDAAALRQILDDQFIATFGTGKPLDKEAFIRSQTKGEIDPTVSQTLTDRTIRVEGDTAVLVETDTLRRIKDGKEVVLVARCTVTYIRRQGRWRALAEHLVKVP